MGNRRRLFLIIVAALIVFGVLGAVLVPIFFGTSPQLDDGQGTLLKSELVASAFEGWR